MKQGIRTISIIAAICVLLLLSFAACGSSEQESEEATETTAADLTEYTEAEDDSMDNDAMISTEQDAIEYAREYALSNGYAESSDENFVVTCDGTDESSGELQYIIHGFDDMEDHTATLFWWNVNENGVITDTLVGEVLN